MGSSPLLKNQLAIGAHALCVCCMACHVGVVRVECVLNVICTLYSWQSCELSRSMGVGGRGKGVHVRGGK